MNGDSQKIYDAVMANGKKLAVLEERQNNQHTENKCLIAKLEKDIREHTRKCPVNQVKAQWAVLAMIFAAIIAVIFK